MPKNPRRDASFVVRIWWERWGKGLVRWRGQVVHAETRQSAHFDSIPTLLAFLEKWSGNLKSNDECAEENISAKQNGERR